MPKHAHKRKAKMVCGDYRGGVKVCRKNGQTFRLHKAATSGTKAKRKAAAKRLKPFRFTSAMAKACKPFRQQGKRAFGKCMARYATA